MPKLTVENVGEFEVPQGKRLVLALEDEARIASRYWWTRPRMKALEGRILRRSVHQRNLARGAG
jgi:hypothetical protein